MRSQGTLGDNVLKERERESWRCVYMAEVYGSVDVLRYFRKQKRGNKAMLPVAAVVAHQQEQSGREMEPIVGNDTLHTLRGHIEKYSDPAAAELGLPTTVCSAAAA